MVSLFLSKATWVDYGALLAIITKDVGVLGKVVECDNVYSHDAKLGDKSRYQCPNQGDINRFLLNSATPEHLFER